MREVWVDGKIVAEISDNMKPNSGDVIEVIISNEVVELEVLRTYRYFPIDGNSVSCIQAISHDHSFRGSRAALVEESDNN